MDLFISYSSRPDLEEIIAKVRPYLLALFKQCRVHPELDIDDVIQETFLRILKQHRDELPTEGLFTSWLIRCCRNVLIDAERKRRQEQSQSRAEVQVVVDCSMSYCSDSLEIRKVGWKTQRIQRSTYAKDLEILEK